MTSKVTLSGISRDFGEFLVPDYYRRFSCKGASCRNTCCAGWTVTVPMDQYFALFGLSCDADLRESLDRAFLPVLHPTPERYAEIRRDHKDRCRLLSEDGWCSLHARCGETALPSVCRYYPRGPRIDPMPESSCSNSCERTLELLFEQPAPLAFERLPLSFQMPLERSGRPDPDPVFYARVRGFCLTILADRSYSLPTRILMVGKLLSILQHDRDADPATLDLTVPSYPRDVPGTYRTLMNVARWFIDNNQTISAYCEGIASYYEDGEVESKYRSARTHFEAVLPDHEILFEKMLVNDLFFRQFPFRDRSAFLDESFVALAGTYAFIRYLALSLMRTKSDREEFIDIMAATFRVVGHTRFDRNIAALLRDEEVASFDALATMLQA